MVRLVCLVTALALVGCGKDECERVYDMVMKCTPKASQGAPSKDLFVMGCNALRDTDEGKRELEDMIGCAKEDSCEAFTTCSAKKRTATRSKSRAQEIAKAIEAGKWKDAWDDCTLNAEYFADDTYKAECLKVFTTGAAKLTGEDLDRAMYRCKSGDEIKKAVPEFDKTCKAMAGGQVTKAMAAVTAARDAGKQDFKICFDLERAAEAAGGDTVAKAKTLCKELDQADDAKEAIDEARANAAAKKADLPFKCQFTADKLAELNTEWSKKTLDELYKACFVELGAVLLEVDPKDAKYVCPFKVKRTLESIAKYQIVAKFPELAERLKKLPKKCAAEVK